MNVKHIEEFLGKIDWLFGLHNYDKRIILKKEDEKSADNEGIGARVSFREDYQDILVELFPLFFKESKEVQRKALLHELCHSFTLPSKHQLYNFLDGKFTTAQQIDFINERETSRIENLIEVLLTGQADYAKDAYKNYMGKGAQSSKHTKNKKYERQFARTVKKNKGVWRGKKVNK